VKGPPANLGKPFQRATGVGVEAILGALLKVLLLPFWEAAERRNAAAGAGDRARHACHNRILREQSNSCDRPRQYRRNSEEPMGQLVVASTPT
jgi:hypothetical protein